MALKTIRLYGRLGAIFGRVHRYDVQSPAEAVKALSVTLEGFQQYLMSARRNGMVFTVLKGKRQVSQEDLTMESGEDDIRIAPIMVGSKRGGVFQTILGAVMVVAGIALSPITGGSSLALAWAGAASMAGGLYQMLSPQPKGLMSREDADNKPSYAFGGPVNTTAVGTAVSLLWGRREVGGAIISAGIIAEDMRA